MKKMLTIAILLHSLNANGQPQQVTIREARRSAVQFLEKPSNGVLRVEVNMDYPNIVMVALCGYKGSMPLRCRENYTITMTTAQGRVVTINDYKKESLGTIHPEEFPLTIDVNVIAFNDAGNYPLHFSVKLMYYGFYYHILLYDDWTKVEGGIH